MPPADEIVALDGVTVARSAKLVLRDISLSIKAGDRIFIAGENGAGKSSLLMLLASRLHPFNNQGTRRYAWDGVAGDQFRETRKHIALVSRAEQIRLQDIHGQSSVTEFLAGHLDGQDFLYRDTTAAETAHVAHVIERFGLADRAERKLKKLSLGEMRLCLVARADLHPRKLYLLDEIMSSLSPAVAEQVTAWIKKLGPAAAVVMTGHDGERMADFAYTDRYMIQNGQILKPEPLSVRIRPASADAADPSFPRTRESSLGQLLIDCRQADFYHDFTPIFKNMTFNLKAGDRILLTGPNGSGKTTLLRIMHGDFYPAWGSGTLRFSGLLEHVEKRQLWTEVQFIAAAHFTYYPVAMKVAHVLGSRYSGSIYDYPETLPEAAAATVAAWHIGEHLDRPFASLSEGEKTRILFARAFLKPAPVYLVDEGFIALSERYFAFALASLARLPAETAVVVAANERLGDLKAMSGLSFTEWNLTAERTLIVSPAPEASLP